MAINDGFVTAVGPDGKKRRVPVHYLDHPRFGYRLPPSQKAQKSAEKKARKESTPTSETPVADEAVDSEKEND